MQNIDDMMDDTETDLLKSSDFYWHHGDYNRVIAIQRVVAEVDPSNQESYSDAGWLLESQGKLKDAEALYKLGVSRNMNKSFIAYQLGFFYFNTTHEYPKAVSVLKRSVTLPDSDVLQWKLLAHTYTHMGDFRDALATWKIIKTKYPNTQALDHNLQEAQADYDSNAMIGKSAQ